MQIFFCGNGILFKDTGWNCLRGFREVGKDDRAFASMDPHEAEDVFILSGDDLQLAACERLKLFA